MAVVVMFCSKTRLISNDAAEGIESIALRHPQTHASTGWTDWQVRFPMDVDTIRERRREEAREECYQWDLVRFRSGAISCETFLKDMQFD